MKDEEETHMCLMTISNDEEVIIYESRSLSQFMQDEYDSLLYDSITLSRKSG